jgi:hypothetical protein
MSKTAWIVGLPAGACNKRTESVRTTIYRTARVRCVEHIDLR